MMATSLDLKRLRGDATASKPTKRIRSADSPIERFEDRTGLTFGIELEMNVAISKEYHKIFEAWERYCPEKLEDCLPFTQADYEFIRSRAKFNVFGKLIDFPLAKPKPKRKNLRLSSEGSQTSIDSNGKASVERYIAYLLSHNLPYSPKTPSTLGIVAWYEEPKVAPSNIWHITGDSSFTPRRRYLSHNTGADHKDTLAQYRVGGPELVSKVLNYYQPEVWQANLRQIREDLNTDEHLAFQYEDSQNGLHIHFGVFGDPIQSLDTEIGLEVAKTVAVLYGLFEDEIESWFPLHRRFSEWAPRLRFGMENLLFYDPPLSAPLYMPFTYIDRVYSATGLFQLVGFLSGENDTFDRDGYASMRISRARGNKPSTLEFRAHPGTVEPVVITWWVRFCARLVSYSCWVVQRGTRIQSNGPMERKIDFTRALLEGSILDIIGMEEDGKIWFRALSAKYRDVGHVARRELQAWKVEVRESMVCYAKSEGHDLKTDYLMDRELRDSLRHRERYEAIRKKYGLESIPDDPVEQANIDSQVESEQLEVEKRAKQRRREDRLARGLPDEEESLGSISGGSGSGSRTRSRSGSRSGSGSGNGFEIGDDMRVDEDGNTSSSQQENGNDQTDNEFETISPRTTKV